MRIDGIEGRVIHRGDHGYDEARRTWNRLFSFHPAAIVYAASTEDVVAAVTHARRAALPLRIRGGGHCLEGWSSLDDGVIIDVSALTDITVDPARRTVTVGAGVSQAAAVAALGATGLAVPTGSEGSVGLAGATLGGGFGLLTRPLGMACDNLLAVRIVVADDDDGARVLDVDADHHGDLLRALRGGGNGSFGVVTSLTFSVHALPTATMVTAEWGGLDAMPELFDRWQRHAPLAPAHLTSQLEIRRDGVTLTAVSAGGWSHDVVRLLEPVLSVGRPVVRSEVGPWPTAYASLQIPLDIEPANWRFRSQFVDRPLDGATVDVIRDFLRDAPTAESNYFATALGGVVPRNEPRGGSVFAHRAALFYAEPGAGWGRRGGPEAADDPLTARCMAWVDDFAAALAPFVSGAYPNVPIADDAPWAEKYWGSHVEDLTRIKAIYDPADVFRHPQSIPLDPTPRSRSTT